MSNATLIKATFEEKDNCIFYKSAEFNERFEKSKDNQNLQNTVTSLIDRLAKAGGEYKQAQHVGNGVHRLPPSGSGPHECTLFFYKTTISYNGKPKDLHVIEQFYITSNDKQRKKKDDLTGNPEPIKYRESEIKQEFREWLDDSQKKGKTDQEELKKLKTVELIEKTKWMNDFQIKTEFHIFETHEWISAMRDQELGDYRIKVYEAIQSIYNQRVSSDDTQRLDDQRNLYIWKQDHLCLIYEKAYTSADKFVLLLHQVANAPDSQAEQKMIEQAMHAKYEFTLSETGMYDIHEISRVADRAYPHFLLNNDKLWMDIQKTDDNSSNLSLLPAQIEILEKLKFPVFINGQAGSGKSTLLFYLFADLCYLRLMGEEPQESILFITENQRLLEKSRDEIVELLTYNPAYEYLSEQLGEKQPEPRKRKIMSHLKDAFSTLKQFMLLQASNLDFEIFEESLFINFYKFKEQYLKSPNITQNFRKKYSPEMAWYVIRTFIKGYDKDENITPDRYSEIPNRDRKSIQGEDFKEIYEKVWLAFYKPLQEKGYWDHLDLVKALFKSDQQLSKHAFIVCDEAQDFTKLELEFLIKCLNISEGYDLSRLKQFPLLFAGDPFQTVNPTGFSWQRLKSMFTEEIVQRYNLSLTSEHQNRMVQELQINYRSTPELVMFANAIQYFRINQLQNDMAPPQEARQYQSGKLTYLLPIPDGENMAYLSHMDSVIVIVPCEMGEEQAYQKQDKVADLNYAMLSAGLVKGLEEPKIAVYKFGQHFLDTFLKQDGKIITLAQAIEIHTAHSNDFFRMAYFFNKLYVAVTRAREELYIIDTASAVENFWKPLEEFIQHLLQQNEGGHAHNQYKAENNGLWKKALLGKGQTLSLFSSTAPELENLENIERWQKEVEFAKTRLEQYIEDENPDLILKVCLPAYLRADRIDSTMVTRAGIEKCKAYHAWFQEDWPAAGDAFLKLKAYDKAKLAYWYAGKWREIQQMVDAGSIELNIFERFIVDFMRTQHLNLETFITAIEFAIEHDCLEHIEDSRLTWRNGENFIPALTNRIREQTPENKSDWLRLANALQVFKMHRHKWKRLIGDCFVKAGAFEEALAYYDPQKDKEHPEYLQAKSQNSYVHPEDILKSAIEVLDSKNANKEAKIESRNRLLSVYQQNSALFTNKSAYHHLYTELWMKSSEDLPHLIAVVEEARKKHLLDWRQLFTKAYSAKKVSGFIKAWVEWAQSKNGADLLEMDCLHALDIFQESFKLYARNRRLLRVNEQEKKLLQDAHLLADAIATFIVHSQFEPKQFERQGDFSLYDIVKAYIQNYYKRTPETFSLPFLVALCERTETYFSEILKTFDGLASRKGLTQDELSYLQMRILKVKYKQIDHIKRNPNPDKKNDPSRLERELDEKRMQSGLGLSLTDVQALPEYPPASIAHVSNVSTDTMHKGESTILDNVQIESDLPVATQATDLNTPVTLETESLPTIEAAPLPLSTAATSLNTEVLQQLGDLQKRLQQLERSLLQHQTEIIHVRQEMDALTQSCLSSLKNSD